MYMHPDRVLKRLGLPEQLLTWLRNGTLEQEVKRCQRVIDLLNERTDAWEASNPELASKMPWFEQRQAWKAEGRPPAPWWEVLNAIHSEPLQFQELGIIDEAARQSAWYHNTVKNDPEKKAKYKLQRPGWDLKLRALKDQRDADKRR